MKKFNGITNIGIREKDTNKLIAVYPHNVEEEDKEIEGKVLFWFYQQSCDAEEKMKHYFVDALTDKELKALNLKN